MSCSALQKIPRHCLLVPHYNHHEQLQRFLPILAALELPIIVVDDGSCTESVAALQALTRQFDCVELILLEPNRGKGVAVMGGIQQAAERGFTHAVQIDADGQHCAADVTKMIAVSVAEPERMVSGLPQFGDDVPLARLRGRQVSLWLVRLETLSMHIQDAMCGFRVYPCEAMLGLNRRWPVGARMQFDLEVLVRWMWAGRQIRFVATAVQYPETGLSHYRMVADNLRIGVMHTRLVVGMLLLSPLLVWRNISRK